MLKSLGHHYDVITRWVRSFRRCMSVKMYIVVYFRANGTCIDESAFGSPEYEVFSSKAEFRSGSTALFYYSSLFFSLSLSSCCLSVPLSLSLYSSCAFSVAVFRCSLLFKMLCPHSFFPFLYILALKAPNTNCSRRHFYFLLLSFEENKA